MIESIDHNPPAYFYMNRYEIWPAQHDWLRRYFVFERANYALEEIVAAEMSINFNGLYALIEAV